MAAYLLIMTKPGGMLYLGEGVTPAKFVLSGCGQWLHLNSARNDAIRCHLADTLGKATDKSARMAGG
jgi:hypothetical protein